MKNERIRQNHTIAWRDLEGESVLIDPSSGTVFVLNEVGSRIWQLLESPTTPTALEEQVAADHQRPTAHVREDVAEFLDALSNRRLIESVE